MNTNHDPLIDRLKALDHVPMSDEFGERQKRIARAAFVTAAASARQERSLRCTWLRVVEPVFVAVFVIFHLNYSFNLAAALFR